MNAETAQLPGGKNKGGRTVRVFLNDRLCAGLRVTEKFCSTDIEMLTFGPLGAEKAKT